MSPPPERQYKSPRSLSSHRWEERAFGASDNLVTLAVFALLSSLMFCQGSRALARQRLDQGFRAVLAGLY